METEGTPKPADTAGQAQPTETPVEIEVVDTPSTPEGESAAAPAPQLIFGKYRSQEEAEKGFKELERMASEKAQEAAELRRQVTERQAPPTPVMSQQPPSDLEDKIRERLAENPGSTIFDMARFAAQQIFEEQQAKQREIVRKFQALSSRPEYAEIQQEVAAELPFADKPLDAVEALFLRKRLAKLEAAIANGATAGKVPFVEPGNAARRSGASALRVELDPDTAKMRGSLGDDKLRELAKITARQKQAGGSMREMSIDDWEKANA